jgi:hypothetical protein
MFDDATRNISRKIDNTPSQSFYLRNASPPPAWFVDVEASRVDGAREISIKARRRRPRGRTAT